MNQKYLVYVFALFCLFLMMPLSAFAQETEVTPLEGEVTLNLDEESVEPNLKRKFPQRRFFRRGGRYLT